MKSLLLLLSTLLFAVSCVSTRTTINTEAMASVKTVAIMPIEMAPGTPPEVADEVESAFTTQLMGAGFKVVERRRISALLKEQALAESGLTSEQTLKIGQLTSADALLFGKVLAYEAGTKAVQETDTNGAPVSVNRRFYNFKVSMRVATSQTGELLIAQENSVPYWQEDPKWYIYQSMAEWRGSILNGMANDLKKAIKDAAKKK